MRIDIKKYMTVKEMNKGVRKMEKKGWQVVNTDTKEEPIGCLFLLPNFLLPKKTVYIVTYQK